MKLELQAKLFANYPAIFRQKDLSMQETCMIWGIETPDIWYNILDKLCFNIQTYVYMMEIPQIEAVQVKEKFGCYAEDTEILTDQGWKYFKDLNKTEKIATLNIKTKEIEYQIPTDYISYNYKGKMYKLINRGIDLLVTPNHKLYISKGFYYNGRYKPCKKIYYPYELVTPNKYFREKKTFLKTGKWNGEDKKIFLLPAISWSNWTLKTGKRIYRKPEKKFNMKYWLEFLGFYVAEGCVTKEGKEISIACCNRGVKGEKETLYIENLLNKLKFSYSITLEDKSAKVYRIYDKQLGLWLLNNCGHLAQNKRTPNFVKELSSTLIKKYLIGLYRGDGCKNKTSYILTTTSKKLADDVQELIFKCEDCSYCNIRKRNLQNKIFDHIIQTNHITYEINWLKKSKDILISKNQKSDNYIEEWIDYNGTVYCITVPNKVIYIRRKGKVFWCGNSLRFYTNYYDEKIEEYISEAERWTTEICSRCGSFLDVQPTNGWIEYLCKPCREKYNKSAYNEEEDV